MNDKKRALGMGLNGLISSDSRKTGILEIDINLINPNPKQPRDFFDEDKIKELAQSIKENGLLQPVLVVKNETNSYNLIAGERRFRAVKFLNQNKIKAIVVQADEASMIKNAIIENIQREDLTTIEEALGYDMMIKELNLTHQEVADQVGKSRSHISNMIRILTLPQEIIDLISRNKISFGHAKILLSVDNPLDFIEHLNEEVSVRKLEDIIKSKIFNHKTDHERENKHVKMFFKKSEINEKFSTNNTNNTVSNNTDNNFLEQIAFSENSITQEAQKNNEGNSKVIFNLIKNIYSQEKKEENNNFLTENSIDDEVNLIKSEENLDDKSVKISTEKAEYNEHIQNLENYIKHKIGLNIKLNINIKDNSGSVNIAYKNFEELEKILSYLF